MTSLISKGQGSPRWEKAVQIQGRRLAFELSTPRLPSKNRRWGRFHRNELKYKEANIYFRPTEGAFFDEERYIGKLPWYIYSLVNTRVLLPQGLLNYGWRACYGACWLQALTYHTTVWLFFSFLGLVRSALLFSQQSFFKGKRFLKHGRHPLALYSFFSKPFRLLVGALSEISIPCQIETYSLYDLKWPPHLDSY